MRLHYQKYLKSYAQRLRKGGHLSAALLWHELKNDKLKYRFLRQRPIGKFIVDYFCSALNLAIEIDGAASHDTKIGEDETRQKALESMGIKIIRFTDADIRHNLGSVGAAIQTEILRLVRSTSPPPSGKEE